MNKKSLILLITILSILLISSIATADYLFSVPEAEIILWVENDGTMSVSYDYTIENRSEPIEYIDVGLPNGSFNVNDATAELNGSNILRSRISRAKESETGLKYGITVDIRDNAIWMGKTAHFYLVVKNIGKMLYENDSKEGYVGFNFQPSYFGSKYCSGITNYTLRIVLPAGLLEDDPVYYNPEHWPGEKEPESWFTKDGLVVYEWKSDLATSHQAYTFGASFPRSVLTSEDQIVVPGKGNNGEGSDDDTIYGILGGLICLVFPVGFIIWIVSKTKKKEKGEKNLDSYLPPRIRKDGQGIKRGLTAVEASVLLELPVERVISMILFGLTKKGVLTVNDADDLKVTIKDPLPNDLHDYETDFIAVLKLKDKKDRQKRMKNVLLRLIADVADKMEGFSLEETKEYYQGICKKAWSQVEAADTPEIKGELLDKNFGWAMLNEDPEKKITTVFRGDEFYAPSWWWRMDPTYPHPHRPSQTPSSIHRPSSGHQESSGSEKHAPVLPGAQFARSVTNSARSLGAAMVYSMSSLTGSVKAASNPAPISSESRHISSSSGSSSGGGSSCDSCACACACDSCACACAGGGR